MPEPEITNAEVTPEVSAPETTPAVETPKEETATEEFQRKVAEIEAKREADRNLTLETDEEKPEADEESAAEEKKEEVNEADLLKAAGLTQKSLSDVKDDLNKARSQAELFNFLSGNVEGFGDFLTQQIMIARGLQPKGKQLTLDDLGQKQPEPDQPKANMEKLLERYDEGQIQEFKELLTELAPELGFVKKDDLAAEKEQARQEKAKDKAITTFNDFGKSDAVKTQLKAMSLDWEKDVKQAVVKMLTEDFGIDNFGKITPKNIARAYNTFIMEKQGGIEKLLSNVKSEATKTHEEKLKLGQTVPQTGHPGAKPAFDLQKFLNDPNTTSADIKKRMQEIIGKRR